MTTMGIRVASAALAALALAAGPAGASIETVYFRVHGDWSTYCHADREAGTESCVASVRYGQLSHASSVMYRLNEVAVGGIRGFLRVECGEERCTLAVRSYGYRPEAGDRMRILVGGAVDTTVTAGPIAAAEQPSFPMRDPDLVSRLIGHFAEGRQARVWLLDAAATPVEFAFPLEGFAEAYADLRRLEGEE
jgi:hypothetical protein